MAGTSSEATCSRNQAATNGSGQELDQLMRSIAEAARAANIAAQQGSSSDEHLASISAVQAALEQAKQQAAALAAAQQQQAAVRTSPSPLTVRIWSDRIPNGWCQGVPGLRQQREATPLARPSIPAPSPHPSDPSGCAAPAGPSLTRASPAPPEPVPWGAQSGAGAAPGVVAHGQEAVAARRPARGAGRLFPQRPLTLPVGVLCGRIDPTERCMPEGTDGEPHLARTRWVPARQCQLALT